MKIFRFLPYTISLIFLWFAYWQWNDPDRWLWIAVYVSTAIFTIVGANIWELRWWLRFIAALTFLTGIYLLPKDLENWLEIEQAREGFGLLICAAGVVTATVCNRQDASKSSG